MPGITQIDGLKTGKMHHGSKHKIVHNGQKIGGMLKAHHYTHHPEIKDEETYGSNLDRLKQSLKSIHISNLPKTPTKKNSSRYIDF